MLASGTGGFVIVNTNDLLGGMEKIAKEQNEYYLLGYTPSESSEGSCHTLKVKVEHGYSVRFRTGYCNVHVQDLLAGNETEKTLEGRATGSSPGTVAASMQTPFFYTSPNTARVAIAMEIPPDKIDFAKQKGKFHAEVSVLGLAYRADGGIAARFSDALKLEVENKKELEAFQNKPLHYENEFTITPGKYTLKVVFSSGGDAFGKLEQPLLIDPYDAKQLTISGVAFSHELHKVTDMDLGRDSVLLQDRTPLVAQGFEITPSGANRFSKTDMAVLYVEIYEPLLRSEKPPTLGLKLRILDKSAQPKLDTGFMNMNKFAQAGNAMVPSAIRVPVDTLSPGSYTAELQAADDAGHKSILRTTTFDVQ